MKGKRGGLLVFGILLCQMLGGCAGGLLDQAPRDFLLSRQAQVESAAPEVSAGQPQEEKKSREPRQLYDFLEEGSGYALAGLSAPEQIWYRDMERILGSFSSQGELSREGLAAGLDESNLDKIFQCVLNDHPELFYVDGYSYTKYTGFGTDTILSFEFSGRYTMEPAEAGRRREQIREAADAVLSGIDPGAGQYEKVKYVYETLILQTDYQLDAPDNQNIYSVLVNHRSVCQGYAKTTQYLLNRLGVECALALGTVETGEGHAWNLVKVDGSYYYVDATWGDASYQLAEEGDDDRFDIPEINYDYLNVTTEELLRTHTLDDAGEMPLCADTAANYYVREGALFTGYDREQMQTLFERAYAQQRKDVTVKCSSPESYEQVLQALIRDQEIFDYLSEDSDTVAYTQNDTQLSLTFWMTKR